MLAEFYALVSVVMIDLVLAGDNAVVVGMAAAGLPLPQRQRVIMIGVGLALLFRVLFAVVAVQLLAIIGLLLAGGLLLLWVAWKMWRELHQAQVEEVGAEVVAGEAPATLPAVPVKTPRMAIVQIAIADVSMSLDNVLAVAGAARDHLAIMIFGLALSIALMAVAATWIARLLTRHHWLAYIGLVIITVVALGMIWEGGEQIWFAVEDAMNGDRRREDRWSSLQKCSKFSWPTIQQAEVVAFALALTSAGRRPPRPPLGR